MIKVDNVEKPFVNYMQKVIPLAFNESLSYYEQLCLILNYIKNEITPSLNTLIDDYSYVVNSVEKLQKYINDYFNSEDFNNKVTTAIDTKLNAMVTSGELENIITAYLKLNALICFDTIALMKASTNLTNGSYVKTYGSTEFNNKKGAFYKVRTKQESDVVDEVNIIELYNNLVAVLILQDDFDSLQTQVNNLSDSLNTTNQKVTELETGLNTTNTNVSNVQNDLNTTNNNLNTTNNNVSNLQNKLNIQNFSVKYNLTGCTIDNTYNLFNLRKNSDNTIFEFSNYLSVNLTADSFFIYLLDSNNEKIIPNISLDTSVTGKNTTKNTEIECFVHFGTDGIAINVLSGANTGDRVDVLFNNIFM